MIVHPNSRKVRKSKRKAVYSPFKTVRSLLPPSIEMISGMAVHHLTGRYFNIVDRWVRAEGKHQAVKRLKSVYVLALRSLANDPTEIPWIKTNKRGFPSSFDFLEKFYFSQGKTPQAMQAVLSILGYYRNILAPGKPDLSPITDAGPDIPTDLIEEIINLGFNPDWKIDLKRAVPVKLDLRSKVGPNGQSTVCALQDLKVLPENLVESILYILSRSSDQDNVKGTLPRLRKAASATTGYHSRLSIKREKGGKDRVFAMVDYWTQITLKPLHKELGKLLDKIPNDCTFDQGKGLGLLRKWTQNGNATSVDLSSASDRFPMQLQVAVMEKLIDKEFSQAWETLMVDRQFTYKNKFYKWAVGQPLGAYSSWPSFALSHHIVMRAAYRKAGIDPKDQYLLLGDDMAAVNSKALVYYLSYLSSLGVATSPTKGLNGYSCEFAKRVFYKGCEVSPVPVPMLDTLTKDVFLLPEYLAKVQERSSDLQSNLRVSAFLGPVINILNWDKETVAILSQYPLPQMRHILNTEGSLEERDDLQMVTWNGKSLEFEKLWEIFQQVKYKYMLRQVDNLTKDARAKLNVINKLELPATPAGIRRQHPLYYAYGNYFDEVEDARGEVRGFLTAKDWTVEVPSVHLTNLTTFLKGSVKGTRHSGKLLLEVWKEVQEDSPKARTQTMVMTTVTSEGIRYTGIKIPI